MSKNFLTVRIEAISRFRKADGSVKCRTIDLGGFNGTLMTRCKNPKSGDWETQRYQLPKSGFKPCGSGNICGKNEFADETLDKIREQHGHIRKLKGGGENEFTVR